MLICLWQLIIIIHIGICLYLLLKLCYSNFYNAARPPFFFMIEIPNTIYQITECLLLPHGSNDPSIDRSTFGFFFLVFYEPERNQSNSLMDVLIE